MSDNLAIESYALPYNLARNRDGYRIFSQRELNDGDDFPLVYNAISRYFYTKTRRGTTNAAQLAFEYWPPQVARILHTHIQAFLAIRPASLMVKKDNTYFFYDYGFGEWLYAEGYQYINDDITAMSLYNTYLETMHRIGYLLPQMKAMYPDRDVNWNNYYGNIYDSQRVCWGTSTENDAQKGLETFYGSAFNYDLNSYMRLAADYTTRNVQTTKVSIGSDKTIKVLNPDYSVAYQPTMADVTKPFKEYKTYEHAKVMNKDNYDPILFLINPFGKELAENIILHYLMTEYKTIPGVSLTLSMLTTIY